MVTPKTPGHKDKVVKGNIAVGPEGMESECNSEARDKALRRRLLKALGTLLVHENTNLQPFHPGETASEDPDSADVGGTVAWRAMPSVSHSPTRRSTCPPPVQSSYDSGVSGPFGRSRLWRRYSLGGMPVCFLNILEK